MNENHKQPLWRTRGEMPRVHNGLNRLAIRRENEEIYHVSCNPYGPIDEEFTALCGVACTTLRWSESFDDLEPEAIRCPDCLKLLEVLT